MRGGERQKHPQPLQRAGTAAGERARFRARQTHGVRVIDFQPVHDNCLREVAMMLVGLVKGAAGAKAYRIPVQGACVEWKLTNVPGRKLNYGDDMGTM